METYADQIRKISEMLTEETWNKGNYFAINNDKLCMCVHGAGQSLVNPQVKLVLGGSNITLLLMAARASAAGAASTAAGTPANISQIWKIRGNIIKNNYVINNKDYGNFNLHYLMGMFGITASFQDSKDITLMMLKDKLQECAEWAEQNQEFLQNN